MARDDHARQSPDEGTLRLQREANQKLVLAAVRAQQDIDDALGAQQRAEFESSELRSSEEKLRSTAEFRERLLGIIGHDLRDPLNTLNIAAGLLHAHGNLTPEDARLVTRMMSTGQRMSRMIGQLVGFTRSRLGAGFGLHTAPNDLAAICRDIAEELRIRSPVELVMTSEGDVTGTWDCDHLAEALTNIVGNAVEHATPGTPVLIHTCDHAATVVIEITNTGPCIPPEVLPVIFEAFKREGATGKRKNAHLGLGLYIACEITRAHGGSLRVRSSDGTTTFTMVLPRIVEIEIVPELGARA